MGNCGAKRRAAEKQALLERQAQLEAAGLTGAASDLINTIDGSSADLNGAASGYGDTGYVYATYCPEGIPEDIALLATAAALAAGRTPPSHPEGYLEAFANIYKNFALAVRARVENSTLPDDSPAHDFPSIKDGIRGMAFIEAVVASSHHNAAWTTLDV